MAGLSPVPPCTLDPQRFPHWLAARWAGWRAFYFILPREYGRPATVVFSYRYMYWVGDGYVLLREPTALRVGGGLTLGRIEVSSTRDDGGSSASRDLSIRGPGTGIFCGLNSYNYYPPGASIISQATWIVGPVIVCVGGKRGEPEGKSTTRSAVTTT